MDRSWRYVWEQRFQQRHGYPSQGPRADLERQAAFLDDILAHRTPATNVDMLNLLLDDFDEAVDAFLQNDRHTLLVSKAQSQISGFDHPMCHFYQEASDIGVNLKHDTLLRHIDRSSTPVASRANYENVVGVIPTIEGLQPEIVVNKRIQQLAATRPQLHPRSSLHSYPNVLQSQTAPGQYRVSHQLPYNQSSCRVCKETGGRFQHQSISPFLVPFPQFEPSSYVMDQLPDYLETHDEDAACSALEIGENFVQKDEVLDWSCTPSLRSLSSMSLLDDDDYDGTQTFSWARSLSLDAETDAPDSASSYATNSLPFSQPEVDNSTAFYPPWSSYAAALKSCVHSASKTLENRQLNPLKSSLGSYLCGRDNVEASKETTPSGKLLCSPMGNPERLVCDYTESLPVDALLLPVSRIRGNNDLEDESAYVETHQQTLTAEETPVLPSESSSCSFPMCSPPSDDFRHPFNSVEHLSQFHSYKQRADRENMKYHRIMQNHEREMHRIASACWLPGDVHRRLPNRFEVLSLHGDSSLLDYSNTSASHDYDSDREMETQIEPMQMRLRGGSSLPTHAIRTPLGPNLSNLFHWSFAERFVNSRGNEYFCDIDEDYLTDRFNLTSLNTEVQYYQYALDLITDVLDIDVDDETREHIEKSARHLYGLVHARYIVTTRGLQKMSEKFKNGDFGKCPRVACDGQPLLPMGQHDNANISAVKLYCARCEDLYNPKSSRHASVDGAYFGSSFHNMFFQVHPNLMPAKSQKRYEPKIFGFKVHAPATLARWQVTKREETKELLKSEGLETGFEEEERQEDMDASEEEEEDGQDGIDDMFEGQKVVH